MSVLALKLSLVTALVLKMGGQFPLSFSGQEAGGRETRAASQGYFVLDINRPELKFRRL